MGCIACHDPHYYPAVEERTTYYRKRCLNCHSEKGCSVPVAVRMETSKDDSCMQCHMPRGESDIQHHSITDHRVPRRANQPDGVETGPVGRRDADLPVILFHQDLLPRDDPEAARDLGIALVDRVERYSPSVRRELGRLALRRLDAALKADPGDVPARDAKAHALWAIGDATAAAAAFDEALTQSPRREVTLQFAAALALERKRPETAIPYLERALEVNPWRHEFHYLLAEAQARRGDWLVVRRECQESLRLNPSSAAARLLLVECYLKSGQTDEARAEFERVLGLNPPNADALRQWFAQRVR
jgi:tetratricopeptide (TPR) repeat protein